MCGIAGFTQFHRTVGDQATLQQMAQKILHRGPDAGGEFVNQQVGLCHRRLSIIDLSVAGNQPLFYDEGRLAIVFNGEIYNFLELRESLLQLGYKFKTKTDTEVLLALYQEYGVEMVKQINGMFAFAIWDNRKQSLFIARDRIGKKPLYFTEAEGELIFGSELKSLLELPEVKREIRLDAVFDFFAYQYVPDPKTIFDNIYKLEPGHFLVKEASGLRIEKYWDISFKNTSKANEDELRRELQQHLKDCTAKRMLADVPLGAFLSGGVDSSGVVALMAQQSKQAITTCSIGFDEEKFNETEFAQVVADQYKTRHHEMYVHENVADSLVHIASFFDEPFADPSLVPTYFVSKLAREKVTVAVAGDGGDEVFAGYSKYNVDDIENRLRSKFPKFLRQSVFPPLAKLAGKVNAKPFKKAKSLLTSLSVEPAHGFYITNSMITDQDWHSLVRKEVAADLKGYHPSSNTIEKYRKADGPDHLPKILYTDMKTYLPGGILVKVDRMSMANSLEVRAPILDYKLMEFAATVPSVLKFNNGEKKYLLKEAFKKDLPDDILYRKKMGFSVPLASWLRNELRELTEDKLIINASGLAKFFKPEQIAKFWHEHKNETKDHSNVLWSMLMFQLWWDEYMSSDNRV